MERVTISMSDAFAGELAAFMADHRYDNRSEAVRDLARRGLEQARFDETARGDCLATLSYVFEHRRRDLPRRLIEAQHARHDLQVVTLHVHLDHDSCLEVAVLRGEVRAVRDFARGVIAETGVRYGTVTLVPIVLRRDDHAHGTGDQPRPHGHAHPKP